MRRLLVISILGLLTIIACALLPDGPATPGIPPILKPVVIHAQTLPVTKTVTWDAPAVDATHGAADSYLVTLDGKQVGTPTGLTQSVTFTTLGPHTVTVAAVNFWGPSTAATLNVVVAGPGSPTNIRIQ